MILRRVLATMAMPVALVATIAWAIASEDPAALAKKTLSDLEAKHAAPALSGSGAAVTQKALDAANQPIAEAKKLLARAAELRRLNDVPRAEIAEDAALEWALTARELVRAVELESDTTEKSIAADDAGGRAARARALLDEAIARRATLQKAFDQLEKESEARALDAGKTDGGKKP